MSPDQLLALFVIAGSASITPGPNNAILASTAALHGARVAVPTILGIVIGFPVMMFLVAVFLGEVFQSSALLRQSLKIVGVVILLWMAWRTATAGVAGTATARKPLTFMQSAGFQWVNPKSWTFAIGVSSQFVNPEAPIATALLCALAFGTMSLISVSTWTFAGKSMTRFLTNETRMRAFNVTMAFLIVLSVAMLFWT